jgi:3-deoxy-D-manno-octulosonate 8-phosphate phosphatase (KDO 8-P phosphatase)
MATNYKTLLKNITTLLFDVDGVFTNNKVILLPDMEPVRVLSARDGYAVQYAVKKGMRIGIITGGRSESVHTRMEEMGIQHVFSGISDKKKQFEELLEKTKVRAEHVLYMGDDIPDLPVLRAVGLAACPQDAVREVKNICNYVSPYKGGDGCVRDIVEQTLKVQGKWMDKDAYEW